MPSRRQRTKSQKKTLRSRNNRNKRSTLRQKNRRVNRKNKSRSLRQKRRQQGGVQVNCKRQSTRLYDTILQNLKYDEKILEMMRTDDDFKSYIACNHGKYYGDLLKEVGCSQIDKMTWTCET